MLWITVQGVVFSPIVCVVLLFLFLGSVAKALSNAAAVDNLVLLLGSGSVIGRLIMGFISDLLVSRLSRAFFYVPAAVIMIVSHLSFAFFPDQMLYPASFMTGFAYGMSFATSTT